MRRLANPELVFKTTSPDALAWFDKLEALRQEEIKLRNAFEDEMLALYGPSQRTIHTQDDEAQGRRGLWVSGDIVTAVDSGYNEQPPADSGWRLDSKDRNWKPKLATKQGKEWRDRLATLNLVKMKTRWQEIGIPFLYWGDSYIYNPGIVLDRENRVLYVMWGTQYAEPDFLKGVAEFPSIEWEKIPLSEYHAFQESLSTDD